MSTRRLAAIMFTDIAGYTAMMQENEAKAIIIRARHREVFERQHRAHRGQIVQYYGDGTLSVFDSAIDAAACAVAMQAEFRETPSVPLRIGIHTGDILVSETEVIGDGVNLASRVESLAVPGSVLVSESVYDNLKNQDGFSGKSLGVFTFKNVSKPVEVFALEAPGLTMPEVRSLTGKFLKRESRDKDWFQRMPIWAKYVAGFVVFLLLAPFIYSPFISLFDAGAKPNMVSFVDENGNTFLRQVIPSDLRKSVYLHAFQNQGQDSTIDWMRVGIPLALDMDFDQDPYIFNMFQPQDANGSLKDALENAKREGCSFVLNGDFSQENGMYQIDLALLTVPSGQPHAKRSLQGPALLPLLDEVSFAAKEMIGIPQEHLRDFVDLPLTAMLTSSPLAYQKFSEGVIGLISQDLAFFTRFEEAIALDSTFSWASYSYARTLYFYQRSEEVQKKFIDKAMRTSDRLPDMFEMMVKQLHYRINDMPEKALELSQLMVEIDPDKASNWTSLISESFLQEDFELCLDAIEKYRKLRGDNDFQALTEAQCHLWLGDADKGLKAIENYMRLNPRDQEGLMIQGQLLLVEEEPEEAKEVFKKGSLFYPAHEPFELLIRHCDHVMAHGALSEGELQDYVGEYWIADMPAFGMNISSQLGYLVFQAGDQSKLLMFPYDKEDRFAMSFTAKAKFSRDSASQEVTKMFFEQKGSRGFFALRVDDFTKKAHRLIKSGDLDEAIVPLDSAIARHPSWKFLQPLRAHLDYISTDSYKKSVAQYQSVAGIYQLRSQNLLIEHRENNLYLSSTSESYGMAAHKLLEFKPDHFVTLDNLNTYLVIERGPRGGVERLVYRFHDSDEYVEAERVK